MTADRRVADGLGDDDGLDRPCGLGHRTGVGRRVEARVEGEQGGEALGGVAGRDDDDRSVGHRRDLARGEDDVRVVRQDDDLAGIDRADGLEQLAGARVRRLAAVDDRRDAEVAEDRREAVPGRRPRRRPAPGPRSRRRAIADGAGERADVALAAGPSAP